MSKKRKKSLGWFTIVLLMVSSVVLTVVLAVDASDDTKRAAQFDWIETLCSLLSGAASVILGVVAIVQGERANKLAEELAEIDRMQFENASVTASYPMIKFDQELLLDSERWAVIMRFSDVKEVTIKEAFVSDMHFYPYTEDYRAEEEDKSIVIQKEGKRARAKEIAEGKYEVAIKMNPEDFRRYERFCLEFNLEVVNVEEVAIIYKFKLLVEGIKGRRGRSSRKVRVFHQFYEIEVTMGEEKWEEEG